MPCTYDTMNGNVQQEAGGRLVSQHADPAVLGGTCNVIVLVTLRKHATHLNGDVQQEAEVV